MINFDSIMFLLKFIHHRLVMKSASCSEMIAENSSSGKLVKWEIVFYRGLDVYRQLRLNGIRSQQLQLVIGYCLPVNQEFVFISYPSALTRPKEIFEAQSPFKKDATATLIANGTQLLVDRNNYCWNTKTTLFSTLKFRRILI